jgi:hypothetical protein
VVVEEVDLMEELVVMAVLVVEVVAVQHIVLQRQDLEMFILANHPHQHHCEDNQLQDKEILEVRVHQMFMVDQVVEVQEQQEVIIHPTFHLVLVGLVLLHSVVIQISQHRMEHLDHQQEDGLLVEVEVLEVLLFLRVDLIMHLAVLVVVVMDQILTVVEKATQLPILEVEEDLLTPKVVEEQEEVELVEF